MRIVHVVGARPNFMKVKPVIRALGHQGVPEQKLVHTGQHYDTRMSKIFFEELQLPEPDINLGVGSGTHAWQTANIMISIEKALLELTPDMVLVYGDVNSTVAASLVCAKLLIPVGHVEAGLRSFDRSMPEEINRLLTDQISDLLFTPSGDADENLRREGIAAEKIHRVGNVMIDTLIDLLPLASSRWNRICDQYDLTQPYGLVTLHRPSNVDDPRRLAEIAATLTELGQRLQLLFPIHPRTRKRLADIGLTLPSESVRMVEPVGYLDFLALLKNATLIITDSGGIQEETTYLDIPCLTVRENTERPVTVTMGTNTLIRGDARQLVEETAKVLRGDAKQGTIPPLWDGHAGMRIAEIVLNHDLER